MRPFVIVTMNIENTGYDMELPTDVPISRLRGDIIEVCRLHSVYKGDAPKADGVYCERLHQILPEDQTLAELGIWSGDILRMG